MIRLIIVILFCLVAENALCQKMYVWSPKENPITERHGFLINEPIDLVVFDARTLTEKSKIECSSEEITTIIAQLVKKSLPSAMVNILHPNNFYKASKDSVITLKISVFAYHAAFGSNIKVGIGSVGGKFSSIAFPEGKWNAVTGYEVIIFDNRNGKNKFTETIFKVHSQPNMMGYRTAKNALNSTFIETNQNLFAFLENCFLE